MQTHPVMVLPMRSQCTVAIMRLLAICPPSAFPEPLRPWRSSPPPSGGACPALVELYGAALHRAPLHAGAPCLVACLFARERGTTKRGCSQAGEAIDEALRGKEGGVVGGSWVP